LQSKIAALVAEERAQHAVSTSGLDWRGVTYPVRNKKVRLALTQAEELLAQLSSAMDADDLGFKLETFDKLINSYNEAKAAIRSAMSSMGGGCCDRCLVHLPVYVLRGRGAVVHFSH
jgi:RNA-binding signal recognition particle 68